MGDHGTLLGAPEVEDRTSTADFDWAEQTDLELAGQILRR
jgi:hypothetical protein